MKKIKIFIEEEDKFDNCFDEWEVLYVDDNDMHEDLVWDYVYENIIGDICDYEKVSQTETRVEYKFKMRPFLRDVFENGQRWTEYGENILNMCMVAHIEDVEEV